MNILAEQLGSYSQKDYYPFHMPGHKRNPFSVGYKPSIETDITEIDGFDNLHHAEGILKEAQERAARLFGSKETIYSVNGSTAAILSAISACTSMGGRFLMARNCHKAVYHCAYIRQLRPVYLYPQRETRYGLNGGIEPQDVKACLEAYPDIQAVMITSPTYDGVVSDVRKIAEICHKYGKPLIVDEAHGAHFVFCDYFPDSALIKGADVVIQSLHKTLPSMTQTALLHRNSDRVSSKLLHRYMGIYQSSSPSYPLMASIDSCICGLETGGEAAFRQLVVMLQQFYKALKECRNLRIVDRQIVGQAGIYDWDPSKLILMSGDGAISGRGLYRILLEKYHIQMEMETTYYVLGIASIGDVQEGFQRLSQAIFEIDQTLPKLFGCDLTKCRANGVRLGKAIEDKSLSEAMDAPAKFISLSEAKGKISAEFVSLYPPGIPLIVPGERIGEEFIDYIEYCIQMDLDIHGLGENGQIGVVYE